MSSITLVHYVCAITRERASARAWLSHREDLPIGGFQSERAVRGAVPLLSHLEMVAALGVIR